MLRNLLLPRRERSVDHLPVQDVETGPLLHLSRAASGTNHSSANAEANTESNTSMSHSTTVTSTVTYGALDEYDYENNSRSSLADDQSYSSNRSGSTISGESAASGWYENFFDDTLQVIASPLRNTANLTQEPIALFNCEICFENNSLVDAFTFQHCLPQHKFCLPCISAYAAHQIRAGVTYHVCPGERCRVAVTDEELQTLVDVETFAKYLRFRKVKSDPTYRECTKCGEQVSKAESGSIESNLLTCLKCGKESCYFHGDAHSVAESCSEYANRINLVERQSTALMEKTCKKCPRCMVDTEKAGGCNHMTCRNCQANWCWLCRREIESNHYARGNLTGCPGQQFRPVLPNSSWLCFYSLSCCSYEMRENLASRVPRLIEKIFDSFSIFFAFVIAGGICLTGTILFTPLVMVFLIGIWATRRDVEAGEILLIIPTIFAVIGCFVAFVPLECLWLPFFFLTLCFSGGEVLRQQNVRALILRPAAVVIFTFFVG